MSAVVIGLEERLDATARRAEAKPGRPSPRVPFLFDEATATSQRRGPVSLPVQWLIQGITPRTGTKLNYGKGGSRKTQLELHRVVHIAAVGPNRPNDWCGQAIGRRGRCVIYTAEDQREAIEERIWDIIVHDLGMDPSSDDALDTRARIIVVAPLSMTEDEFSAPNLFLFRSDRGDDQWKPNATGESLFASVAAMNDGRSADDEDRIVAIVIDSVTSVAGFELTDNLASSNFVTWLNRASIRLDVSVTAIAHTPKSSNPDKDDPEAGAAERLAGGFAWSTGVRITEEVRRPLPRHVANRQPAEWWESRGLPEEHEDAIVVMIAKSNLLGSSRQKLWLSPRKRGGFVDVTPLMRDHPRRLADWLAMRDRTAAQPSPREQAKLDVDRSEAMALVEHAVQLLWGQGKRATAALVQRTIDDDAMRKAFPAAYDASNSGRWRPNKGSADEPPVGTVTWLLAEQAKAGRIVKVSGAYQPQEYA